MKTAVLAFPLSITLASAVLSGCSTPSARTHKPAYVAPWGAQPAYAQPVPQEDLLGAPPGSRLSWVQGYWAFVNWRWFWVPGHWEEQRPAHAGVWIPGQWDRRGGEWQWRPGHWEKP